MKKFTIARFGPIASGIKIRLSLSQALAREHLLPKAARRKAVAGEDKSVTFTTTHPLNFKPGEVIYLEGDLDRGMEQTLGVSIAPPKEEPEDQAPPGNSGPEGKKEDGGTGDPQ